MTRIDRVDIAYTLTFTMPFHCGTGLRVGLIDRTVVRDHDGYLYIPGSTIKGVLREQCERLTCLFEDEEDKETLRSLINPHHERMAMLGRGRPLSMVTRIFGSQSVTGQLFFDDARQTIEQKRFYESRGKGAISEEEAEQRKRAYQGLQTDLATQVRIARPTRTAVPGALYTSEFGIRDLTFEGAITGWLECFPITDLKDQPTYSLLLLLVGLHLLERIGSNKSSGKGRCQCRITALRYGDRTPPQAVWQSWFDHLGSLSYYSLEEDGLRKEDA